METAITPSVNVGLRVKFARELAKLTQERVSSALGFNDRQTLSDIETGKRAVKADELLKLSDVLDQDVEFFIDPFSVVAEAKYSWRASPDLSGDLLDRFEAAANGWVGLLRWLLRQQPDKRQSLGYKLNLDISSSFEDAQRNAENLVRQHSLGPVPARRLTSFIEEKLGIAVLFVDTGGFSPRESISGAACHLPDMGVILVNRNEPEPRRNFDLAHELFHSLTWGWMPPDHRESNSIESRQRNRRVEQLADNFAAALLMPRASLDELIDPARADDVKHLGDVSAQLHVSVEALGWRLRSLGRIDERTRMQLSRASLSYAQNEIPALFSESYINLLHTALDKGRLSARKAAKTMGLSLHELASLFGSYRLSVPFSL